jgi:hypothetical protein
MENASEEDSNEGKLGNQQAAVIDQENPSDFSLITFRIEVEKGALAAGPSPGSSYFEWSILLDPIDIDGPEEQVEIGGQSTIDNEGDVSSDDSDDEENEENIPDLIDNVEKSGRALDDASAETPHPSLSINYVLART